MNELIEVKVNLTLNINSVSARTLYLGLGLSSGNWSEWSRLNIEQNEFFACNVDWIQLLVKRSATNPNPASDYAISIDFAKHISMQARTTKSHDYRNYMIDVENKKQLPKNFAQALRLAADLQEDKEKLEAQVLLDSPKVKFSDVITESANTRAIRYWIKALKHENNLRVGEKAVFQWLRDNKYIFKDQGQNVPMSKYEANGLNYFSLIVVEDAKGKPRRTMHITGKGMLKLTPKILQHFGE